MPITERETIRIWERFSGKLRGYLRKQLRNAADADDVLQEVFVRVHRSAAQLEGEAHLAGWLFTVARSALVDFQRRRGRPPSSWASSGRELEEDGDDEVLAEHAGIAAGVHELLAALPEPYARAVALVDLEGRTFKEAAAELELSISGAKSRVQRGRALLRDALLRCCHFVVDHYGTILDAQPVCCCCPEDHPAPRRARG